MTPRLVHGIAVDAVEAAIRAAERRTTGELRVGIARFYFWGDVQRAAARAFARLGMDRTRHRNGVLLFIAPRQRRFAVVADVGIAARVAPTTWNDLAARLGARLRGGELTGGLTHALAELGDLLAVHFPLEGAPDVDELPNEVARPR